MIRNILLFASLLASAQGFSQTLQPVPPREVPSRPGEPRPVPRPGTPGQPVIVPVPRPPTPRPPTPPAPRPPTPPPHPPTPPPPPPPPTVDEREIHRNGANTGSNYADDVLDSYGIASQIRFNFRQGLLTQRRQMGDYDRIEVVRSSAAYHENLSSGHGQGQASGTAQGHRDAQGAASNLVSADINAAIDEAINSGRPIRFVQAPRSVPYGGAQANIGVPSGVLSQLEADESQIRSQLERYLQVPVSRLHLNSLWDVSSMYREDQMSIPREIEGYNSFSEWRDREWDSRYSRHRFEHQRARGFLREITDAKYPARGRYEDIFRNSFREGYGWMLRDRWPRVIQQFNAGADSVGRDAYMNAATDYARALGYFDGYMSTYTPASISSFNQSIIPAYSSIYPTEEARVRNNSNVVRPDVQIIDVNTGTLTGTMGHFINITVNTLTNRGMKDAEVIVEVVGSAQVRALKKASMVAKGLSKLAQPVTHEYMAQIEEVTAPDQQIPIQVVVGGYSSSHIINATFEELIHSAGAIHDNLPYAERLVQKITGFIAKEWEELSGWNNQYKERRPDKLMVRLRTNFDTQPEDVKAQLRTFGPLLRKAIGEKPSKLDPKRNDWNTANDMFNEMGML